MPRWCVFDENGRLLKCHPAFIDEVAGGEDVRGQQIFALAARPAEVRDQFSRCVHDGDAVTDITEVRTPDGPGYLRHTYFKIPPKARVGCACDSLFRGELPDILELECLGMMAREVPTAAIARKLQISASSIGRLIRSVKKKLRVKTLHGATAKAKEHGLI